MSTKRYSYQSAVRSSLVSLVICSFLFGACTRRPVQKDVVLQGDPTRHSTADRDELKSSGDAANAPPEKRFIDTYIELQLNAIDAEQLVYTRSHRADLKQFVRSAVADQQKEIGVLRQLRATWFADQPKTVDMDLIGAKDAFQSINIDRLDPLKENAFDQEFFRQFKSYQESISKTVDEAQQYGNVREEFKQAAQKLAAASSSSLEELRKLEISSRQS